MEKMQFLKCKTFSDDFFFKFCKFQPTSLSEMHFLVGIKIEQNNIYIIQKRDYFMQ